MLQKRGDKLSASAIHEGDSSSHGAASLNMGTRGGVVLRNPSSFLSCSLSWVTCSYCERATNTWYGGGFNRLGPLTRLPSRPLLSVGEVPVVERNGTEWMRDVRRTIKVCCFTVHAAR
jgi:hypothetical protein